MTESTERLAPIEGSVAAIVVYRDGRCGCHTASRCPLRRFGSMPRCTREELEKAGYKTVEHPGTCWKDAPND